MQSQLEQLKAQLTSQTEQNVSTTADKALSGKMTKFAELDLNERIAEKRYALSVAAVEAARMMSERKMLYLHEIVCPGTAAGRRVSKTLAGRRHDVFGVAHRLGRDRRGDELRAQPYGLIVGLSACQSR